MWILCSIDSHSITAKTLFTSLYISVSSIVWLIYASSNPLGLFFFYFVYPLWEVIRVWCNVACISVICSKLDLFTIKFCRLMLCPIEMRLDGMNICDWFVRKRNSWMFTFVVDSVRIIPDVGLTDFIKKQFDLYLVYDEK